MGPVHAPGFTRLLAVALLVAEHSRAMTPDQWAGSARVEEVDLKKPGAMERVKAWDQSKDGPLLIKNWQMGKQLKSFRRTKEFKAALAKNAAGRSMKTKSLHIPAKIGQQPWFSYFDESRWWLGKKNGRTGTAGTKKEHARIWHDFETKTVTIQNLFENFAREEAPYMYWTASPMAAFSTYDPRPEVCEQLAHSAEEERCLEPTRMEAEARFNEGAESVWANSAGVRAQAHFDRNDNINIHIKGEKRWTMWGPHQLDDLCFYPYTHPSDRQVQADLGEGIGGHCPSAANLHNRTVVVKTGDVLLIPAYYPHRVETLSAAINYNAWYNCGATDFHDKFGTDTVAFMSPVIGPKSYPKMTSGTDSQQKKARRKISAMLRWVLRESLKSALRKPKLSAGVTLGDLISRNWQQNFAPLPSPDLAALTVNSTEAVVSEMCADEASQISEKEKKGLRKLAKHFSKSVEYKASLWEINPGVVREELRYAVGETHKDITNAAKHTKR